ncbi:VOC family protein [Modestobacter excelsi]|uniref:VOC family protein n=1 Tax=Modestobacter excelsi TaxID=2213161 RepID=UPI00110CA31F|nr:VOC family protein [Modestobacter excelsi]
MPEQRIVPNLWFDSQAEEAAQYYIDVFGSGRVTGVVRYPDGAPGQEGAVMAVEFEAGGMRFVGINGGPMSTFSEAVSFQIDCADQAEVDRFWDRFIADGGEGGQCGWLKDKYGLSWQVQPVGMTELFADPDPARAQRAVQAMLGMQKLDMAALRAAADGVPVG